MKKGYVWRDPCKTHEHHQPNAITHLSFILKGKRKKERNNNNKRCHGGDWQTSHIQWRGRHF